MKTSRESKTKYQDSKEEEEETDCHTLDSHVSGDHRDVKN